MNTKIRIIETTAFSDRIAELLAKHSLLQEDYNVFKKELAENPEKGDPLTGTGGVRKVRLKSSSRGKSGGFRVCYLYYVLGEAIYLLFIFQKNEQENLSAAQKKALKNITDAIKGKK
ncbi:MAG TPA: type II toxin-antitoxin system RelE/ParE family toxin [Chlamydiales bacterium]|nr:type II toxin-antitoxin system RelE/ParE family toxin [Chlamydiales bacterium]